MPRCLLALLVALFVVGCFAPSSAVTWHGDVTFTAEERAKIEAGAAFMSAHAGEPIAIVWDASHVVGACPELVIRKTPGVGGEYVGGAWCISLGSDEPEPGFLSALAAHELGHWLGLEHVGAGLMQPFGMALEWSDADEAEAVRVGLSTK